MPRLLIVDDSRFIRNALKRLLSESGYEIIEAANGVEGLKAVEENAPDCILLDLLMPEMDGFEMLGQLRQNAIDIPVIIVSADIQKSARDECIRMGAVDFLDKPPKKDNLRTTIERALTLRVRINS